MAEVVSARVGEDLLDRLDHARGDASRGAWLLDLITRELTAAAPSGSPGARSLGPGIPAPGVLCMWAACMSCDSDRYGVTDPAEFTRGGYASQARDEDKCGLALCQAHAATLEGGVHKAARRELPPSWRRRQPDPAPA